ncbi:C39 family peptidase [Pseudoflavonifractor sp. 60]|uniref:C39 family peptidase n=1 Tax=Pseudoflavonifractor sp. 60 TaxID=2304576 RepID=UPI00325AE696
MKKFREPLSLRGAILLALVLALVCIGAVELIVCSYQAPELYEQITAPVRSAVQFLSETGQTAWESMSQHTQATVHRAASQIKAALQELEEHAQEEPEEDIQLVDNQEIEPPPRARASFSITSLASRRGQEYLTGGALEIVYYNQTASRWADEPYGSDPIGGYGCGPTAMAMAVSSLTDSIIDPAQMAQHCVEEGYWAKGRGSYRSIVYGVAEDFGLECTSLSLDSVDEDTISHALSSGKLIVALMGRGHFTNRGHFILLRGVTLDGSILVADPASPERSLTTWDLDLILDELSAARDNGAPLWLLSQPLF